MAEQPRPSLSRQNGFRIWSGIDTLRRKQIYILQHNNSPLPSDCFWDVQVDADNRLCIATTSDVGLVSYDGTAWTTYDTDNSGIALNEVTKITLDIKRDLIWLTHYGGLGLSVARMNCHYTAVHSITAPNIPTVIYDLSGRRIANPTKGIYIKEGKKYVKK